MKAVIVSDLHMGSRYFLSGHFERFLGSMPQDHMLILNGDIIDNPYEKLQGVHQGILEVISEISHRQKVVWVQGNHDNGYLPSSLGKVHFRRLYSIGQRLLIMHGDQFDEVMPRSRAFILAFSFMHSLRVRLGAKPVHVAHYAKKWEVFYKVLRKNVMMNAVKYAVENGYEAVTCGHTHFAEDRVINGIRYINTGAWTELPAFYLVATPNEMTLKAVGALGIQRRS